jgi:hypothetical protein
MPSLVGHLTFRASRCAVTRLTYSAITVLFVGLSRLLEVCPREICAISITGSCLFLVVHQLEPNRHFAVILKGAILAAGGVAIVSHLP